jgi:alkanesulfonate monooxygenase SsuD/methylene tetrahydromethanopterin reductase-like flavin-dependent oxidoreductase (luciferase family)
MIAAGDGAAWRERVRQAEDLGFDALLVSDWWSLTRARAWSPSATEARGEIPWKPPDSWPRGSCVRC